MKRISEKQKVTLTIGQIKRLVRESFSMEPGSVITIERANTWTTTPENLKSAHWTEIDDCNGYYIATQGEVYGSRGTDNPDCLAIFEKDGDGDWSGIETDDLKAVDEDGTEVTLTLSAAVIWSEEGRDSYYAYPTGSPDGDEVRVIYGDWDERLDVTDLSSLVGVDFKGKPEIDYDEAVSEWMLDNCDEKTHFWMDDERGFANEWTLYIDYKGRDELTLGDLPDNDGYLTGEDESADHLRELDEESARYYIKDAVMTRDDYRSEHGSDSCVTAIVLN